MKVIEGENVRDYPGVLGYTRVSKDNIKFKAGQVLVAVWFDGELDMFTKEQTYGRPVNEKKERKNKLWAKKLKKQQLRK